jgi:signal transduction histidine kinase
MKAFLLTFREKFWQEVGFSGLDPEEHKKRTTAVQLGMFTALAGFIYSMVYVFLGFSTITIPVLAYVLLCFINLVVLRLTKNYQAYTVIQLLFILFLPFVVQLYIGGFVDSSSLVLASFLTPSGALLFARRSIARIYFFMFLGLVILAGFIEHIFFEQVPRLPRPIVLLFFVLNLSAICGIIYYLMESFLKKQEELRAELKQSIAHLKATQTQLIHSEKMASLGELTAGIAHEIQNPLNFVNNFSEVSNELLQEMKEELAHGKNEEAIALADDVIHNLEKILHHGQRADAIVKGMLQHSRSGNGQKELTDINTLADEYLRLAYHGLRAKDKSFNCTLETYFDQEQEQLEIVPQEIGRVLLNLYNNAFYAVYQKQKLGQDGYEPRVTVSTSRNERQVELRVKDNGMGIAESVKNKIFQPFFTTKPTGQGTGLGLSLSYDIITKGHGGEMTVETEPGYFTELIVSIPLKSHT